MGCGCNKSNKQYQQQTIVYQEELMELKRPTVPVLKEEQKDCIIVFIVGVARGCNDGNKFVDYIIRWLIEDGITYEKYDITHPYASKFGVNKTPTVIIKVCDSNIMINWLGIALTYREIIIKLSQI